MSTRRKKTTGHPGKAVGRPTAPGAPAPTAEALMYELVTMSAERLMRDLKLLESLGADRTIEHYIPTHTAYQAAALALMESIGLQDGSPPLSEQARKVITRHETPRHR